MREPSVKGVQPGDPDYTPMHLCPDCGVSFTPVWGQTKCILCEPRPTWKKAIIYAACYAVFPVLLLYYAVAIVIGVPLIRFLDFVRSGAYFE
jgi:hypothetical protein